VEWKILMFEVDKLEIEMKKKSRKIILEKVVEKNKNLKGENLQN
jgi:hypothetical protein